MAQSQIDNVDVVTNSSSIVCLVVVSEHLNMVPSSDGNLRNVGDQIVRNSSRVLSDSSTRMRADRIEVAQERNVPRAVRDVQIAKNLLDNILRAPVWIRRTSCRLILRNRDSCRITVDRR